jgi:hypothetical protein
MLDRAAMLFEFREVEQAQDVVGARIIDVMSVLSRSLSERDDIAPDVKLIGPHLAPRMIISVAITILDARSDAACMLVKFVMVAAIRRDASCDP